MSFVLPGTVHNSPTADHQCQTNNNVFSRAYKNLRPSTVPAGQKQPS